MIEVLASHPSFCVAVADGLFLTYWRKESCADDFQREWDLQRAFAARTPGKKFLAVTYVSMAKFSAPDKASREVITARARTLMEWISASLVILPQKGFGAAMIRSVLAGLNMVTSQPVPTDVFSSIEAAGPFIAKNTKLDADIVQAVLDHLLKAITPAVTA
jgi:hypothetical protein